MKQKAYEQRVQYITEDIGSLEKREEKLQAELLLKMDELRAKNEALAYANTRVREMADAMAKKDNERGPLTVRLPTVFAFFFKSRKSVFCWQLFSVA